MRAGANGVPAAPGLRLLLLSAAWLAVLGLLSPWSVVAKAKGDYVAVARVKGAINPVTTGYLTRVIDEAEAVEAAALIIEMDTPGGLDSAMRDIIQRIVSARVPIVVYVSPAGSRAASAGTFIAMAAHVSAMAPNTSIGAAHPVAAGGPQPEGAVADKVLNDAASYIRSLARERGRNAEWAERAVRDSVSANEQEAVRDNIVDLTAPNLAALLDLLEGRSVRLATGPVTLRVKGLPTSVMEMTAIESFLFTITDPNIAFILLSLALTAIFLELSNPGAILPGIVGGILLLLAFYALGTLPVNFAGLLLVALAFLFFLAEVLVTTHGMLAIGGAISLGLGGMLLFSGSTPYFRVSWPVLAAVVGSISAFFFFTVTAIVRSHRQRATTGSEALLQRQAAARTPLDPEGYVFLDGERWRAESLDGRIEAGEPVRIERFEGMKLLVSRLEPRPEQDVGGTASSVAPAPGDEAHKAERA